MLPTSPYGRGNKEASDTYEHIARNGMLIHRKSPGETLNFKFLDSRHLQLRKKGEHFGMVIKCKFLWGYCQFKLHRVSRSSSIWINLSGIIHAANALVSILSAVSARCRALGVDLRLNWIVLWRLMVSRLGWQKTKPKTKLLSFNFLDEWSQRDWSSRDIYRKNTSTVTWLLMWTEAA